jgi:hypothetical protein
MPYPQDIAEDESELGFQHLELDQMDDLMQPARVVARILSSSDVLIKTVYFGSVLYSHQRWGYWKSIGNPPDWMPLLEPMSWDDAQKLIQEFDFGGAKESTPGDTVGLPFTYRVVE